jgi:hypothetical protein
MWPPAPGYSRPLSSAHFAVSPCSQSLSPQLIVMIQRPRYLLFTLLLWVTFFFMKLVDDYDGIMSWIGAPIVATILLAITLPIVLVLGLVRRIRLFSAFWYSGTTTTKTALLVSLGVLIFGHSLGLREAYTFTNSLGDPVTASRLHSFASLPAFVLAAFSVLYWPATSAPDA